MTPKKIKEVLERAEPEDVIKITTTFPEFKHAFFVFKQKEGQHGKVKFILYDGRSDWVYEPGNSYVYCRERNSQLQGVYFYKTDILGIKIMDPVSFVFFLNRFQECFGINQFLEFLTK